MQEVMAAMTTAPWSSSTSAAVLEGRQCGPAGSSARPGGCRLVAARLGGHGVGVDRGRVRGGEGLLVRLVDRRGYGVVERVVGECGAERLLRVAQGHPVLRSFRSRERRLDGRQVELELLREVGLVSASGLVPQPLLLGVRLDERDLLRGTPGEAQVRQRLVVDGEDRAGGTVLRAHVPDGRAVGERDPGDPGPVELDELAHHTVLAQQLGDREHQVGSRRALGQRTRQLEADDLRDQHAHRLAQHGRLGLDASDTPAEDAQAVDHRGV